MALDHKVVILIHLDGKKEVGGSDWGENRVVTGGKMASLFFFVRLNDLPLGIVRGGERGWKGGVGRARGIEEEEEE